MFVAPVVLSNLSLHADQSTALFAGRIPLIGVAGAHIGLIFRSFETGSGRAAGLAGVAFGADPGQAVVIFRAQAIIVVDPDPAALSHADRIYPEPCGSPPIGFTLVELEPAPVKAVISAA